MPSEIYKKIKLLIDQFYFYKLVINIKDNIIELMKII